MHPNAFTSSRGRCKATTKPAAPSVPFRAADHLPIAKKIADALREFGLPSARCDASNDPRLAASLIDLIIVYLL